NGTFQNAVNYAVGANPEALAIGDLNGDHHPDLAVANRNSANASILLGNGNGTFQSAISFMVATNPVSVVLGDFNVDGRLDLAAANQGSNCVSVLLGNCVLLTPTPTNTPAGKPTGTPTPAPLMLVGHVMWQGHGAQPNALQVQPFTITLQSGATEVDYGYQLTDANGFFTMSLGTLPPGVYGWRVKGPAFLASSGTLPLALGVNEVEMGMQRAGDINGDNSVNVVDFSLLRANFGTGGSPPLGPGNDKR
ncbi:MAG: FG-GAP-like repeat-containing protein, partial [Chloroflexia bacterium]